MLLLQTPPLLGLAPPLSPHLRRLSTLLRPLTPRITRLALPSSNAYLVHPPAPGPRPHLLIDTGPYVVGPPPLSAAVREAVGEGELQGVLLTGGPDSAGGLAALLREFPRATVRRGRPAGRGEEKLEDGTKVEVGGERVRCLAAPGAHDDGFAFFLESEGALFSGDAAFSRPLPPDFADLPALSLSALSLSTARGHAATLASLLQLFPYFLLPLHGTPVLPHEGPATVLERALEAHEALGRAVVAAIKAQGAGKLVPTRTVVDAVAKKLGIEGDAVRGAVRVHLAELGERGAVVRHAPAGKDPEKVFGPGGLNMVQVMGLIKDREKKDREMGKGGAAPAGGKAGGPGAGEDDVDGSSWEVIS
ncbi:beta-lactamase-like protein [Hyaloraphidium curvatum]|nr:beta-lactamase-like protein [Hyaloraphidium curvatum]